MSSADHQKLARIERRYRAERRFKAYGIGAVVFSLLCLFILLTSIFGKGLTAFYGSKLKLSISLDAEALGLSPLSTTDEINQTYYQPLVKRALYAELPELQRSEKRSASKLLSRYAGKAIREKLVENRALLGHTIDVNVRLSSKIDQIIKGNISRALPANKRQISDRQLEWLEHLEKQGLVTKSFDWNFITSGDSREPELAGLGGAIAGSFFTLLICFIVAFPIGLATAIYLEELAPKNRFAEIIEININNLAAVPSIIYGLLGLAVLLNFFELPRSTPLTGGLVLALMTLPVIIISTRAALRAVPPSIREGALAMGASRMQVVLHHVLPLALPGTLTGTIIGLSRALGETAPLLMIGMLAFIVDVPASPLDSAAALPVQIYLWAESAERGFIEKTSAAIMMIIAFLIMMNATAVILRTKFEQRW